MTASTPHPLSRLWAWLNGRRDYDTPVDLPPAGMGEVGHLSVARGRTHVLVVDDDRDLRHVTADVLHAHGYAVSLAPDGEEARRMLHGLEGVGSPLPNIILLDVIMPPGDQPIDSPEGRVYVPAGKFFWSKVLWPHPLWHAIPVVMMSSPEVLATMPQFRRLPKPFTHGDLLKTVRQYST